MENFRAASFNLRFPLGPGVVPGGEGKCVLCMLVTFVLCEGIC